MGRAAVGRAAGVRTAMDDPAAEDGVTGRAGSRGGRAAEGAVLRMAATCKADGACTAALPSASGAPAGRVAMLRPLCRVVRLPPARDGSAPAEAAGTDEGSATSGGVGL